MLPGLEFLSHPRQLSETCLGVLLSVVADNLLTPPLSSCVETEIQCTDRTLNFVVRGPCGIRHTY
jgi:hypothetical protein